MRQWQYVLLVKGVGQTKSQAVMALASHEGMMLHVIQSIVHPSHIPFEGEAQAAVTEVSSDTWPGGGILGDHHHARVALGHDLI